MANPKWKEWVEEDKLILITGWARAGLTEEQIAHNMGIGLSTLKDWKKKYPTILTALKKGKEVADFEVENALYRSACGYWTKEYTTIEGINPATGEFEVLQKKTVDKFVPPSNTAQIFWLKNRKMNEWRDKREEKITTEDNSQGVILLAPVMEKTDE